VHFDLNATRILKKYSNINFQENPSSGSRLVPFGLTPQSQYSLLTTLQTCQTMGEAFF